MGCAYSAPQVLNNLCSLPYVINLYNTAREKFGDFHFAVAGAGEEQMSTVGVSLALVGHARVAGRCC